MCVLSYAQAENVMTHSNTQFELTPPVPPRASPSKGQRRFNQLTKKIDALKQQLREWQEGVSAYDRAVAADYMPLMDAFDAQRRDFAYLLDQAHDNKLFKKRDKAKLRHLICTLVDELLARKDDAELKALHDRYSDVTFDEKNEVAGDTAKVMMEDMFGIEFPDEIDVNDPEQVRAYAQRRLDEAQAKAESRRAKLKKSPRQVEREQRQEAEALNIRKSIQDVYRKLAAALHPDRERDDTQRQRKTELMQRVNVAYNKKDLLQLLELQLEVEQVDQLRADRISDERLVHYNKVLNEQCKELQGEIDAIVWPVMARLDMPPYTRPTPALLMTCLRDDIRELKENIAALQHDIQDFQNPQRLKAWLKEYRVPPQPRLDDFFDFTLDDPRAPF